MAFKHFPRETAEFFADLVKNNDKDWFNARRGDYENYVLAPAKAFVEEMGARLRKISPEINYAPKVDKSIFRLFRDARRCKGKAPFKTHMGILFWEGPNRLESSGYYFHLEPPFYYVSVGMAFFPPHVLSEYRAALTDEKRSREISRIARDAEKNGYSLGGDKLKKLPAGFGSDDKTAESLLLHKSLYLTDEMPVNRDFYSDGFTDSVFRTFENMRPYHEWLCEIVKKTSSRTA